MNFLVAKYLKGKEDQETLTFEPVVIAMSGTGSDIFTYMTELESGVYLMKVPVMVRVVTDVDEKHSLMYDKYNLYSDDVFTVIFEKDIRTMNSMNDDTFKMYTNMVDTITKKDKVSDEMEIPVRDNNVIQMKPKNEDLLH